MIPIRDQVSEIRWVDWARGDDCALADGIRVKYLFGWIVFLDKKVLPGGRIFLGSESWRINPFLLKWKHSCGI